MSFRFCSLASSSSGNCQYVETEKTKILVDAGLSGKQIEKALNSIGINASDIDYILVTHEHKDHIKGVGILSRRYNIPILANSKTWEGMKEHIGKVSKENIRVFDTGKEFELKDLGIKTFSIFHDANEPIGFSFYYKNKKISLLTDTGTIDDKIKDNIKDSELLMIESNHDIEMLKVGSYPFFLKKRILSDFGHLSNELAGKLITDVVKGNNETVLLAHLSSENNFPELAYQTVTNIITDSGLKVNKDINLELTFKNNPTKVYNL